MPGHPRNILTQLNILNITLLRTLKENATLRLKLRTTEENSTGFQGHYEKDIYRPIAFINLAIKSLNKILRNHIQ